MTSEIASKKELPEDFDRDQLILKLYKLESDICKSRQNRLIIINFNFIINYFYLFI